MMTHKMPNTQLNEDDGQVTVDERIVVINSLATDKSRVGFIRVPALESSRARFLDELADQGLYKIYLEKISTKEPRRPILNFMLSEVRRGDTLYIKEFARLARSIKDLIEIIRKLDDRGVALISERERLDTSLPTGAVMMDMLAHVQAFERENALERQSEGIAIAKKAGKFKGRKEIGRPEDWARVYELYASRQITGTDAMNRLGLKRNTFYKFVKEEKGE